MAARGLLATLMNRQQAKREQKAPHSDLLGEGEDVCLVISSPATLTRHRFGTCIVHAIPFTLVFNSSHSTQIFGSRKYAALYKGCRLCALYKRCRLCIRKARSPPSVLRSREGELLVRHSRSRTQ